MYCIDLRVRDFFDEVAMRIIIRSYSSTILMPFANMRITAG